MLRDGSSISESVIASRGYRTITNGDELRELGFAPAQCRVPGLLLPLWTTDGSDGLYVYRPDNPRVLEEKRMGKNPSGSLRAGPSASPRARPAGAYPNRVIKYEIPKGAAMRVDCPPYCRLLLKNPAVPLWITEGQKKANSLASRGLCALALLGVWNWKGRNEFGASTILPDFDYVGWDGRQVYIVFNSDVMNKPSVRQALDRLTRHLQYRKAHVSAIYLPATADYRPQTAVGGPRSVVTKLGVDDWLAAGRTVAELEALAEGPRPESKPAEPIYRLRAGRPASIRRLLALLHGRTWAATWLHVDILRTERLNRRGDVIKLDPPETTTERRLFLVRDDGKLFGDTPAPDVASLKELGAQVEFREIPPDDRLWSMEGVAAYRKNCRPDPLEVFERIVAIVDRFIDFSSSLTDQRPMTEMIACYILATWFLDAFNVIGFLWPNGERGSGKTQLLIVVTELAYLGQRVLSGGSFASLRDLADYGATLGFDDAEQFSDPRRTDPDKRALLLAGNRRGNYVPVKEPIGDGWRTRYVNTFCPRLFSAIHLPEAVLASRSIVVPLVRSPDRHRANADPLKYELWPHERSALLDDLWALGLAHLHELPAYEAMVNQHAGLTGRNLEPWLGVLAVAAWLEDKGAAGLGQRMEALSQAYQRERPNVETSDETLIVIRALMVGATYAITAIYAMSLENPRPSRFTSILEDMSASPDELLEHDPPPPPTHFNLTTAEIVQISRALAENAEADLQPEHFTPRRVGRILSRLRLARIPRPTGRGSRIWRVTREALLRFSVTYGVPLSAELSELMDRDGGSISGEMA